LPIKYYNNNKYPHRAVTSVAYDEGWFTRKETRPMVYHIWIDAEHRMTVDDENAETAGDAVSLKDGMIVARDEEDEDADAEDDARDGEASSASGDVLIAQIQEMLARQHNAR